MKPFLVPQDPEARAVLYDFAGLTTEERHAIDVWCFEEQRKRDHGIVDTDAEATRR